MINVMKIEDIRIKEGKNKGKLPEYSWPGGCEVSYITEDYGVLCGKCANENEDKDDPQWNIMDYFVNWEDGTMYCDHCGKNIIPEYEIKENEVGEI